MKYAKIKYNDIINGCGICVSLWTQGCPHRCTGCHNPDTWDFNAGLDDSIENITNNVIDAIGKHGIKRNLSILGSEPLCPPNLELVKSVVYKAKEVYPDIKIYIWSGYSYELLINTKETKEIVKECTVLIDGKFELAKRDITLPLRGSTNQRVIDVQASLKNNTVIEY